MRSVLVIADDARVLQFLRLALRQAAGLRVVGSVDGRLSARAHLIAHAPDVVLVDEMWQRTNALARIREAGEDVPEATVVLLAYGLDAAALDDAFEAGAHAVIARRLHPATLGTLLREVVEGNVVHAPRRPPREPAPMRWGLTAREIEVLGFVAEGNTNSRVAHALGVSEKTVKFHLCNVYRKLGVGNRTEATRHAHVHSLVRQPAPEARTSA